MAKWVTISALGPRPPGGAPTDPEQALDTMRTHWQGQLEQVLCDEPDLVVVPEACDRFPAHSPDQRRDYYRARGNRMRDVFAEIAAGNGCYLAYSAARELPDGTWRNSTQILDRQGAVAGIYDKSHVVIEETTRFGILCGRDTSAIQCDFGTVACAICFDLNFEEIRRKTAALRPDLVVFCSMYHGGLMQNCWAYCCRSHFVGAICGDQCTIISPLGELLAASTNYHSFVTTRVNLDCALAHLDYNRGKFRELKRACGPGVTITDPGHLGSVLITCNLEDRTVEQLIDEFEIERLDDYWKRALEHRRDNLAPE